MRSAWIAASLVLVTARGACLAASPPAVVPHLAAGAAGHQIKLERYVIPPNRSAGVLVKARVNGGPLLRLLLDSGSEYVVLDRAAALHSRWAGGSDLELVGAGAAIARAKHGTAETLQVGDLTLRDVPFLVVDRTLGDGIQGVLPLSVFSASLIRVDFPARELDLLPYPAANARPTSEIEAVFKDELWFVQATVNEARSGLFLLDTGAAFTAVSSDVMHQQRISQTLAERVSLRSGVTEMNAPLVSGSIRIELPSHQAVTGPVVAVDLSTTSRYHGFKISGLIGYSALSTSTLTINYRDRTVRIEPK